MATFDLFRNDDLFNDKQFHNKDSGSSIHEICVKNGLVSASLLISCFLGLCALTHKLEINQLSAINLFMLALGVYYALQDYSPTGKGGSIDYFDGFKVGLYTSLVAILIHTAFIGIYTTVDPSVLTRISGILIWSFNTDPLTVCAITLFQGMASAFIITFCAMQYFKKH